MRRYHPPSTTALALRPNRATVSSSLRFQIGKEFLEVFNAEFGEGECSVLGVVHHPQAAVFGIEMHRQVGKQFLVLTESLREAGDGEDVADRGHGQAASA
jgi:hypothetical protein